MSPAPSAMPSTPWTWPDQRTTSYAVAPAATSAWPRGQLDTWKRRCPRSPMRLAVAGRRQLRRRAGHHDPARGHVGRCGQAGPRPPAVRQALQTVTANGPPYPRATADLHVGLAELDRELDDLPSAEERLELARVLAERASHHREPVPPVRRHGPSPRGQRRLRRRDDLLDQAEARYRRGFYVDIRPIAAIKARIQIAAGDLSSAGAWADDLGVSVDDQPDYLREFAHLTLVRLLLAQARGASRGSDSICSTGSHAAAAEATREAACREIRMLQALAHQASDDPECARTHFAEASDTPEPDSHVRLYLDEGAPMLALLHHAARASDPVAQTRAEQLVQARAQRLLQRTSTTDEVAAEPQPTAGAR